MRHSFILYCVGQKRSRSSSSKVQKPSLSPETEEDLHQRIRSETKIMKHRFSTLQTMIRKDIKENIDHEDLATHVIGMYILDDEHERRVDSASGTEEIFRILTKYWSFLDFGNLENIAENFCSHECEAKKELDQYKHDVRQFCECRVSEFPEGSLNNGTDSEGMEKLIVRLDLEDPSLKYVQNLKEIIANILGQKASKLVLCDIGSGSVIVTFLIPTSLGETLFMLTQEQRDKLGDANVLSLKFRDITVFSIHQPVKKRKLGISNKSTIYTLCVFQFHA